MWFKTEIRNLTELTDLQLSSQQLPLPWLCESSSSCLGPEKMSSCRLVKTCSLDFKITFTFFSRKNSSLSSSSSWIAEFICPLRYWLSRCASREARQMVTPCVFTWGENRGYNGGLDAHTFPLLSK